MKKLVLAALLAVLGFSSVSYAQEPYGPPQQPGHHGQPHDGPPPAVAEHPGPPPQEGFVWISGYHRWEGGQYVWTPGHWVRPPRPRARWVAHHWERRHGEWVMVEGHWR